MKADVEAVHCRAFGLPKAGHRAEEYEDAYALSPELRLPFWAAVADGATESAYAGRWARQLAEGFVAAEVAAADAFARRVAEWQAVWTASVARSVDRLPWYAAAKVEEGAFAAFLGLVVRPDHTWAALAVGDCCLFQLRGGLQHLRWPLTRPEQFHHRPALLASRPDRPLPAVAVQDGTWQGGDTFWLATDALAACLMQHPPGEEALRTPEAFAAWVEAARRAGTLRNDDVAFLIMEAMPTHQDT